MQRKDGAKTDFITVNDKRISIDSIRACQKENLTYIESQEQELVSKINHIDWVCQLYDKAVCGSCNNPNLKEWEKKERVTLNENN